jgi:CHAD domain-containing protein
MTVEREVKLRVPDGFRMPDLGADGLAVTVREPARLLTTYVDTPDLRIVRWGCSLRHRAGEGWTVKLPAVEVGAVLARAEHAFPGDDARRLPVAAADLLRAYVRAGELRPVARLRTIRQPVDVSDARGRPLATVTDDDVSVMDGRRVRARFRELEVEFATDAPEGAALELVARLRSAGAGPVENVSKLRRAMGARASEPPDVLVRPIGRDAVVRDVVAGSIATSVVRLLRHDAGIRIGLDPEDVHQARVAVRRLRSDLRTFRDLLEPSWATPLRDDLRRLGRDLGAVRDAEVLSDRLRGREPLLAPEDARSLDRLLARLDHTRDRAREKLVASMREPGYVALLDALVEAARAPAILAGVADAPAPVALRPLLAAPWTHLTESIDRLGQEPTDEALHAARIRAKRVRYAAEAAAPVFDARATEFVRAAAELQDVLGEHQDAVVARAWLRSAANGSTGQAFVAGQLLVLEAEAAAAARAAWPDAWKRLSRKKLRFWR